MCSLNDSKIWSLLDKCWHLGHVKTILERIYNCSIVFEMNDFEVWEWMSGSSDSSEARWQWLRYHIFGGDEC